MNIKEFIRSRIISGDTQHQIAEKCGFSQATVYKIVNTKTEPSVETQIKVARAYNLPMPNIFGEDRPANNPIDSTIEGNPGYNPQKESAKLVEHLAQSGVDPIKLAYLKQLSELSLEELHKIYLDNMHAAAGIAKNPKG